VFSLLSPGENLKAQKAAPAPSNATPPAQQCAAYIWFGKFKRWPPLPLATPRHLYTEGQHIFGMENVKDGRHYLLQSHATCTTMRRIYLVWKI
jgi:hypothetical protein